MVIASRLQTLRRELRALIRNNLLPTPTATSRPLSACGKYVGGNYKLNIGGIMATPHYNGKVERDHKIGSEDLSRFSVIDLYLLHRVHV